MELHTSNAILIGVSGTRQLNVMSSVLCLSLPPTCYIYIYICIYIYIYIEVYIYKYIKYIPLLWLRFYLISVGSYRTGDVRRMSCDYNKRTLIGRVAVNLNVDFVCLALRNSVCMKPVEQFNSRQGGPPQQWVNHLGLVFYVYTVYFYSLLFIICTIKCIYNIYIYIYMYIEESALNRTPPPYSGPPGLLALHSPELQRDQV
jgi:hypothetical protein